MVPPLRTLAPFVLATAACAAAIAPLSCPRLGFLAMLPALAPLVDALGLSIVTHSAKNATVATSSPINGLETLSILQFLSAPDRREHEPGSPGLSASCSGQARRRPSSRSCAGSTGAGAPVSGSAPLAAFGNAITSRIDSGAGEGRHDPVDAHRDPAVRRRAVAQRVEQEAEPRLRLLGAIPSSSNTRSCTSR